MADNWNTDILWTNNELSKPSIQESNYLLSKSYFEQKEYRRAQNILTMNKIPKIQFMKYYSQYLACEKENQELAESVGKLLSNDVEVSKELIELRSELHDVCRGSSDSWLLYLRGIVESKFHRHSGKTIFIESVKLKPTNWNAWLELLSTSDSLSSFLDTYAHLPRHPFRQLFYVCGLIKFYKFSEAETELLHLETVLPKFRFLKLQLAIVAHRKGELEKSLNAFKNFHNEDPTCLDGLENFAELLLEMGARLELSNLSHKATLISKNHPITHFIIGTYYSVRNLSKRAIASFQNAANAWPQHATFQYYIGREHMLSFEPESAKLCLQEALKRNPFDPPSWLWLAAAAVMQDFSEEALYWLSKGSPAMFSDALWKSADGFLYQYPRLKTEYNVLLSRNKHQSNRMDVEQVSSVIPPSSSTSNLDNTSNRNQKITTVAPTNNKGVTREANDMDMDMELE